MRFMRLEGGKAPRIPSLLYTDEVQEIDTLVVSGQVVSLSMTYTLPKILALGHSSQAVGFDSNHMSTHEASGYTLTGCTVNKTSQAGELDGYPYSYRSTVNRHFPDFIDSYSPTTGYTPTQTIAYCNTDPPTYWWSRFDNPTVLGNPKQEILDFRVAFNRVSLPTFTGAPSIGTQVVFNGTCIGIYNNIQHPLYIGYGVAAINSTVQEVVILGHTLSGSHSVVVPVTSADYFDNRVVVSLHRDGSTCSGTVLSNTGSDRTYNLAYTGLSSDPYSLFISNITSLCSQLGGDGSYLPSLSNAINSYQGSFSSLIYPSVAAGGTWNEPNSLWGTGLYTLGPLDTQAIVPAATSAQLNFTAPLQYASSDTPYSPSYQTAIANPTYHRYFWFRYLLDTYDTVHYCSKLDVKIPSVGNPLELVIRGA